MGQETELSARNDAPPRVRRAASSAVAPDAALDLDGDGPVPLAARDEDERAHEHRSLRGRARIADACGRGLARQGTDTGANGNRAGASVIQIAGNVGGEHQSDLGRRSAPDEQWRKHPPATERLHPARGITTNARDAILRLPLGVTPTKSSRERNAPERKPPAGLCGTCPVGLCPS